MMQQGQAVSDILYLTPEGAPMIFSAPRDALEENGSIPDKKGYSFDGCSPRMLMERAEVINGKIVFPEATSYEIMVLPNFETMTPEILEKIASMVEKGARIIGMPPVKSPSLTGYPDCDNQVKMMAEKLWGTLQTPDQISERIYGEGSIYWGGKLSRGYSDSTLYPDYNSTRELLGRMNIQEDFVSENNKIRFGHRSTGEKEIYFVANRTGEVQKTACAFRATGEPELWAGVTGGSRKLQQYNTRDGMTTIDLEFEPYESYFIIFQRRKASRPPVKEGHSNFPEYKEIKTLEGPWELAFDPRLGGPEKIIFDNLQDWTEHEERGIKYYSGIVTYTKEFDASDINRKVSKLFLDLGVVNDMARVSLNGKDLGVVWCAPWRIDISDAIVEEENKLEIEVANRWINRLLGDRQEPDANVRTVKFKNGLMGGKEYTTGRYTFTTKAAMRSFGFTEPLPSGLLGPVSIKQVVVK
jgi:hypothetical protein